jgi:NTE family protein
MSDDPGTLSASALVRSTAIFRDLSDEQLAAVWSQAKFLNLIRGDVLMRQNTPSDAVYIVVSGRFEVWIEGRERAINEVGVGETIGETGFFSGALRNATIVAARDSVVLALDRPSFDRVAREVPAIYQTLVQALARRLSEVSSRPTSDERVGVARTVAIVSGGNAPIPPAFFERFGAIVTGRGKGLVLAREDVRKRFPDQSFDDPAVLNWLNAIENEYELIAYRTDDTLTDWTRKAIRQADQILIVVTGTAPKGLNPVEAFALSTHPAERRRLVRVHERRVGAVEGTADWLAERAVTMHHHVALQDDREFKSLHRFLTGRALGYVAAGGGGFGPAHIGIYKAFAEHGVNFDILGGASVGAAVLGGFAMLLSPEEVDGCAHDVFVTSKGFKHYTFPRYALLDHIAFDEALRRQFRGVAVEDAWRPYFAVATLVDAAAGEGPYLIRRGPFWKAVRASGSLPAVLPPLFTDDGRMLVDGGVVDNVPLRSMKTLKTGPNLVAHFGLRGREQRFEVDYMSIPGRWKLLRHLLTASGRRKLPQMPGPVGVLQRCLVMQNHPDRLPVGPLDLVLTVPLLPGANFMDFDRHYEVFEAAYQWCNAQIDELAAQGDPALAALLATRD